MKGLFGRRQDADLERRLRRDRPVPRDEFVAMLSDRLDSRSRNRIATRRIVLVAAATAAFIAALAGTGGFAYAASAAQSVANAAKVVVAAPVAVVKTASKPAAPAAPQPAAPVKSTDNGGKAADKEYGHKTKLCHKPGKSQTTLDVDDNAVPAHLSHGDYLGACRT